MIEPQLKQINCTQCGAPLTLLGGHQVHSRVCEYCGAVLDTQENYAVVAQYQEMQEKMPNLPLKIGMKGLLRGVEFTIIGFIEYAYRERNEPEEYWVSYQLYSPTHGYVWLTWEYKRPKRYEFSRRVRSWNPNYERIKEEYTAEVTFIAGELTWIAKLGDTSTLGQTYDPNISMERNQDEVEYYHNHFFNADTIHRAFGVDVKAFEARDIKTAYEIDNEQEISPGCLTLLVFIIVILIVVFAILDDEYGDGSSSGTGVRSSYGSSSTFGK
ncbi:DUF4178 domain-containing protein [Thioflexithrix psekupsensis]|uniref:Uncharacterized protein n=1 Tax=Thioflexithrix psekupsensis TaxID=1570016 RepID=A0A251X566_9GAMM|nr:DUF4178 domain-containing protein [Thioflexithrix psekupsensis]OUD12536.1 hypothetical protein TPSD3_15730 [Thioflexithrix psekupsensis]